MLPDDNCPPTSIVTAHVDLLGPFYFVNLSGIVYISYFCVEGVRYSFLSTVLEVMRSISILLVVSLKF